MIVLYVSLRENVKESRESKEDRNADRKLEQEKLGATALVEGRTKIVATESSSQTRTTLLQQDCANEENGEDHLDIRQC